MQYLIQTVNLPKRNQGNLDLCHWIYCADGSNSNSSLSGALMLRRSNEIYKEWFLNCKNPFSNSELKK